MYVVVQFIVNSLALRLDQDRKTIVKGTVNFNAFICGHSKSNPLQCDKGVRATDIFLGSQIDDSYDKLLWESSRILADWTRLLEQVSVSTVLS